MPTRYRAPRAVELIIFTPGFHCVGCLQAASHPITQATGEPPTPEPPANAITGYAWIDSNSDGQRTADEAAGSNRSVTLFRCGAPWGVVGSAVTNAEGLFTIGALEPGEYQLGTPVPTAGFSPRGADNDVHASGFTDCLGVGGRFGIGVRRR